MADRLAYRAAKRCLDLLVAGAALIAFLPVMAIVAVAVRIRMGSPVIFRHPRPGLHEKTFPCLKFRTMSNAVDASGNLLPDMRRLTAFGKFLRKTSLDELPQLWSVIVGDMSLVGPRPLEIRYLDRYSAEQRRRQTVPPGITGWAQVNGRNAIDWDRKLSLDVWYVDHCGLMLDLKILAMTVSKVLLGSGVAREGQVSMDEFFGSGTPAANSGECSAVSQGKS
jgi:lipopolysaccharide/colanic/teichoic acid biosynthesis glycosyltransferase